VGPLSLGAIRLPPLDRVVTVEALSRASAAKLAYGDRKVSGSLEGRLTDVRPSARPYLLARNIG